MAVGAQVQRLVLIILARRQLQIGGEGQILSLLGIVDQLGRGRDGDIADATGLVQFTPGNVTVGELAEGQDHADSCGTAAELEIVPYTSQGEGRIQPAVEIGAVEPQPVIAAMQHVKRAKAGSCLERCPVHRLDVDGLRGACLQRKRRHGRTAEGGDPRAISTICRCAAPSELTSAVGSTSKVIEARNCCARM